MIKCSKEGPTKWEETCLHREAQSNIDYVDVAVSRMLRIHDIKWPSVIINCR